MPVSDYTPDVAAVGALTRARTRDDQGNELGTYTLATRPTASEVDLMISEAVNEAFPVFGEDIPDAPGADPEAFRTAAKKLVAIGGAAWVELSYFPEQVATGRSPYQQYRDAFEKGLARLGAAIDAVDAAAGSTDVGGGGTMSASWDFPEDAGGLVGWGTRW